uniref:Uncharacterized protein n=1 Tax=Zea mays TaxID=4577 RepID=B6SLW4_MAIZE|nr:hypothetical protein [Zea mays]
MPTTPWRRNQTRTNTHQFLQCFTPVTVELRVVGFGKEVVLKQWWRMRWRLRLAMLLRLEAPTSGRRPIRWCRAPIHPAPIPPRLSSASTVAPPQRLAQSGLCHVLELPQHHDGVGPSLQSKMLFS